MTITPNFRFVEGSFDTPKIKMVCVASEKDANVSLCIKSETGWNISVGQICLTDSDKYIDVKKSFPDAKALCQEIVRRWNEFPEELKR
ncbi:hypothetical protein [Prevotella koreensis]